MKPLIPITSVLIGLLAGYLIFSPSAESAHEHAAADQIWTCSMHPSIRQNEPGTCPLCGMDLIPASGSSDADPDALEMPETAVRLAHIRTATVERLAMERSLTLPGRLVLPESNLQVVVGYLAGRVESEMVGYEGKSVSKGDVLARIWSPDIVTAWQEFRTDGLDAQAVAERLRYWGIDDAQIRRIRESAEPVRHVDISAPVSGVVTRRGIRAGDRVEPGRVLYEIGGFSTLWAEFDAIETDISDIRVGSPVRFTATTLPGTEIRSRITFIDPVVSVASRTVRLRADVSNEDGRLKPDMRLTGTVGTGTTTALAVPNSAVLWTGPRSLVYVRRPGDAHVFERREVTLGARSGDRVAVLSGLTAGELVVVNGAFKVDAEFQLSGRPGMLDIPTTPASHREQTAIIDIGPLWSPYLGMKEALVRSDVAAARSAATRLEQVVRQQPLRDTASNQLREALLTQLANWGRHDLEAQRTRFMRLSDLLVDAIPAGSVRTEVYLQYCPMAFGNTGGRWLSDKPVIENPYLPDTMLGCGDVVRKL